MDSWTNFLEDYSPYYKPNTNMGKLIGTTGGYLSPAQAFSTLNPYESFKQPQQEALNLFEQMSLRPEFERTTRNPFERSYANESALSNRFMTGRAPRAYQESVSAIETPYQDQLLGLRGQMEDQTRALYNQMLQDYLDSPTTFTNIAGSGNYNPYSTVGRSLT